MPENFADRLLAAVRTKGTAAVVGIDPVYARLPAQIREHRDLNDENDAEAALDAILEFSRQVIRIVAPLVPAVKLNSAYFERYYQEGIEGYFELVQEAATRDLIVIGDVKRGDVGHSSQLYAQAHLADPDFETMDNLVAPDAVTVNAFAGLDGIQPFLEVAREEQKGVFAWVRPTNPSAAALLGFENAQGRTFCEFLAQQVTEWANQPGLIGQSGYSCLGAVVGATADRESTMKLRAMLPQSILLVPGYGAQGSSIEDIAPCFKSDGTGALVAASRSIIYAYEDPALAERFEGQWEKCVEQACKDFVADLQRVASVA